METTKFLSDKEAEKSKFRKLSINRKKKQKMPYRQRQKSHKLWTAGSRIWDKGRGAIFQTLRKQERVVSKIFFSATGPQFGLKIKEGGLLPLPWIRHALVWNYLMPLRKFVYKFKEIITLILPCVELIMSNNNNDKVYLKNSEWLAIPCMSNRCFALLKSFYTS